MKAAAIGLDELHGHYMDQFNYGQARATDLAG